MIVSHLTTVNTRFGLRWPKRKKKVPIGLSLAELEQGKTPKNPSKRPRKPFNQSFWPSLAFLVLGGLGTLGIQHGMHLRHEAQRKTAAAKIDYQKQVQNSPDMPKLKPGEALPNIAGLTYLTPQELQAAIEAGHIIAIEPYQNYRLPGLWWSIIRKDGTTQYFQPDATQPGFPKLLETIRTQGLHPRLDIEDKRNTGGPKEYDATLPMIMSFSLIFNVMVIFSLLLWYINHPNKEKNTQTTELPNVTFDDIKGNDSVIEELKTWTNLILASDTNKLGGKVPRGLLMKGPPGNGKTTLARAIANRLKAPFLSYSGSDFVELWVGNGAKKVRDMFANARKLAGDTGWCVLFIDEVDALAKTRTSSPSHSGNDEREQTLNALLHEMDGFSGANKRVIVITATNRDELLDPAFLRPGRMDRHYYIGPPMTWEEREAILNVHIKNTPKAEDIDTAKLAKKMGAGLSGADIANIANEAILSATIKGNDFVTQADFEEAIDKITIGLKRKGLVFTERDKEQITAHEALGHALMAFMMGLPVELVSIVPRDISRRGTALGLVKLAAEVENRFLKTREMVNKISHYILGGRAAEEALFGLDQISSGAADDLRRVNDILQQAIETEGLFYEQSGLAIPNPGEQKHSDQYLSKALKIRRQILKKMYLDTLKAIQALPEPIKNFILQTIQEKETVAGDHVNELYQSPFVMEALQKAGYQNWQDYFAKVTLVEK